MQVHSLGLEQEWNLIIFLLQDCIKERIDVNATIDATTSHIRAGNVQELDGKHVVLIKAGNVLRNEYGFYCVR